VNSRRALGEVSSPIAIPLLRFSSVIPPPVFSVHGRSLTPPTTTLVRETPMRYSSLFSCCVLSVSVCVCVSVCVFLVCVVCLSLPPRASSMGGGARGACSVDSRVRGQASWGATLALTLALPLSPFAEQLGFNPSPAAAVGGGCRYARGGRFAHL